MRVLLMGARLAALPAPAAAESSDGQVRRLCASTRQQRCWVRAELYPSDGRACLNLPDHAFARAIRKEGRRWLVETVHGTGLGPASVHAGQRPGLTSHGRDPSLVASAAVQVST